MMAVSNGARRSLGTSSAASSSSIVLRVSSTVPRMSVFRSSLSPASSILMAVSLTEICEGGCMLVKTGVLPLLFVQKCAKLCNVIAN